MDHLSDPDPGDSSTLVRSGTGFFFILNESIYVFYLDAPDPAFLSVRSESVFGNLVGSG